jgi:hypothetical protein
MDARLRTSGMTENLKEKRFRLEETGRYGGSEMPGKIIKTPRLYREVRLSDVPQQKLWRDLQMRNAARRYRQDSRNEKRHLRDGERLPQRQITEKAGIRVTISYVWQHYMSIPETACR